MFTGCFSIKVVVLMQCMLHAACETMVQSQGVNVHQVQGDSGLWAPVTKSVVCPKHMYSTLSASDAAQAEEIETPRPACQSCAYCRLVC